MSDFKAFYDLFLSRMDTARQEKNSAEFQRLLHVVEPDWKPEEQELFADYCQNKAGLFALFGDNIDLDDWMQKALQFSNPNQYRHVYFKWLRLYFHQLKALTEEARIRANFSAVFRISSEAQALEKDEHNKLAFQSMRLLSLAALGKHAECESEMEKLVMKPVPVALLNDKNNHIYFYSNIYKLIVAALEIRNGRLLHKILGMVTVDDMLMKAPIPLFRKFNTVVMDLADLRPEVAADFNYFYEMRKKWAGFFPNFSLFTMMIVEENTKGLEMFFKSMN